MMRALATSVLALSGVLLLRCEHPVPGWTLVLLSAIAAFRIEPARSEHEEPGSSVDSAEWLCLSLIITAAVFLRLWKLGSLPPGCWFDEAENGLETLRILDGDLFFFTPRNNGRGALQFFWTAPFFLLFGRNVLALRLASATAGILTIPAAWLLFRRLASPMTALLGASLLAVSGWHLTVSRIGFDVVATPLFDVLAVYAAVRACQCGSWAWFAISGAVAAVANYGYTASRATPLILAGCYGILLVRRAIPWRPLPRLALAGSAFLVMIGPLAAYAIEHPRQFFQRSRQVNIVHEALLEHSAAPILHEVSATARMLHEHGDENPRHNLPGRPMLDPVTGALLLLGLFRGWRSGNRQIFGNGLVDHYRIFGLLVAWLAIVMVFGGMLTVRAPHGNRTISAVVPISLLAAMGLRSVLEDLGWRGRKAVLGAVACVLAVAALTIRSYFIVYSNYRGLGPAFSTDAFLVGEYLRHLPADERVTVLGGFNPSVVKFVSGRDSWLLHFPKPKAANAGQALEGRYIVETFDQLPEALRERVLDRKVIESSRGERFEAIMVGKAR